VSFSPTPAGCSDVRRVEIDDNLHTWQPIEEPADEQATPFRVVVAEAAPEPADRKSILLEDPDNSSRFSWTTSRA
jgi:hypothetical protein